MLAYKLYIPYYSDYKLYLNGALSFLIFKWFIVTMLAIILNYYANRSFLLFIYLYLLQRLWKAEHNLVLRQSIIFNSYFKRTDWFDSIQLFQSV